MNGRPSCDPVGKSAGPEVVPAVLAVTGAPGRAEPDAELELKGTAMFALTSADRKACPLVLRHAHEVATDRM